MSHKDASPRTLDLFEDISPAPFAPSGPALTFAKQPKLAGLSDAQLVRQLDELVGELQRRMESGRGSRPELERAVSDARGLLERLGPKDSKPDRRRRAKTGLFPLQEGQRKAVRAALLAGVAPGQVAKHFGLSLAAVRQVLAEAA
jgi:DNA-directed RNA polymerase specialized sigma24 family protein